ncbi:MAG: SAM hydrolase/SAM-dependent halogenase family protein [Candidatus Binatia bacterium]
MRWSAIPMAVGLIAATVARAGGPPTVVFLSDFGTRDDAVAICKGVMLQVDPAIRTIDLTHEVTPYAIADGARLLADTVPHYPPGTVFLAVVDPGVGGARRPMVARTRRGHYLVLPDTGLAPLVADRDGLVGAREITKPSWMRAAGRSSTFHGRDVFAPVAAHLARGEDWATVGPLIATPVRLDIHTASIDGDQLRGEVIATDGPYGNLLTNVDASLFARLGYGIGDGVPIEIGSERLTLPFVKTFSDVPVGTALLYIDSRDRLGVAVNRGSFADTHHVTPPSPLVVRGKGAQP